MSNKEQSDPSRDRRLLRENHQNIGWGEIPYSIAPYVPTPITVVKNMLKLAKANQNDIVYDLGCGDGRILFTAVEVFGVKKAVGYDLKIKMCEAIMRKIEEKGLKGRVSVVNSNFFLADISPASLVTLYLTTSGNSKLKPKLKDELRAGTRIVSHDFPIQGWSTLKDSSPDHYISGSHKIYVYDVPEAYERHYNKNMLKKFNEKSRWRRFKNIISRSSRAR